VTRRDDLVGRLSQIRAPTLVVVGEEDKPFPPWKSRRIANSISGAELVVIPGAGHLSSIENPRPVNDAVTRFLSRVSV